MAEIKSTYDIVMEKTSSLSMTNEEKEEFKRQEIYAKMRGFLQKFLDGVMDIDRVKEEIDLMDDNDRETAREVIKEEGINRIRVEDDNSGIIRILEIVSGKEAAHFEDVLLSYKEDLIGERDRLEKKILEKMAQKGISGSAVIPNILADQEWHVFIAKTNEKLKSGISKWL